MSRFARPGRKHRGEIIDVDLHHRLEGVQTPASAATDYLEWRSTSKRRPSTSTLIKLFGSFNAALEAAGLPTRGRGQQPGRRRKRCKRGHPLTPENRVEVSPGRWRCRKCLTEYQRVYQRERKRRERAGR